MTLQNINLVDKTSDHKLISVETLNKRTVTDYTVWDVQEWVVQTNYYEPTNDEPEFITIKDINAEGYELVNFNGSSDYLLRKAK